MNGYFTSDGRAAASACEISEYRYPGFVVDGLEAFAVVLVFRPVFRLTPAHLLAHGLGCRAQLTRYRFWNAVGTDGFPAASDLATER